MHYKGSELLCPRLERQRCRTITYLQSDLPNPPSWGILQSLQQWQSAITTQHEKQPTFLPKCLLCTCLHTSQIHLGIVHMIVHSVKCCGLAVQLIMHSLKSSLSIHGHTCYHTSKGRVCTACARFARQVNS